MYPIQARQARPGIVGPQVRAAAQDGLHRHRRRRGNKTRGKTTRRETSDETRLSETDHGNSFISTSNEARIIMFGSIRCQEPKAWEKKAMMVHYAAVTRVRVLAFSVLITCHAAADDLLYRYEAEVLPYDESVGWVAFDSCQSPCGESLDGGHFVLDWAYAGDLANYHYWIARAPNSPPPHPLGGMAVPFEPPASTVLLYVRRLVCGQIWGDVGGRLYVCRYGCFL